jgi:hypothetical protein
MIFWLTAKRFTAKLLENSLLLLKNLTNVIFLSVAGFEPTAI